mgnify:CR=1 FL=1
MDGKTEDLLSFPDSKETIFRASMPKLTYIFDRLKNEIISVRYIPKRN